MTDYVGDSYRIFAQPADFDGNPLDVSEVSGQVSVRAPDGTVIVNAVSMAYSTTDAGFFYIWRTPNTLEPGTYEWETYFTGGDYDKHEFGRVRLKARPF